MLSNISLWKRDHAADPTCGLIGSSLFSQAKWARTMQTVSRKDIYIYIYTRALPLNRRLC